MADASHELRTPLSTIAGYTELARTRPDPETSAVALGKVEEEAGRIATAILDAQWERNRSLLKVGS